MKGYNVKIHPLFILLGIFYIANGSGFVFLCYFVSVILHEMAHSKMAEIRGYRLRRIVLMPYGAVLKGGENYPRLDSVLIAITGPIFNFVVASFIIALWWLVPDSYTYLEDLMWANLSLALFNVLPIFPLDGARVILALSTGKAKTLRRLRIIGIIISIILMVLMIVSIFYTFNPSLGIMSIFIMHGAISGTEKELYSHIMTVDNFNKSTIDAIQYLDIGISSSSELFRFLECIKQDRIVTFHVLDDDLLECCALSESDIKDIILQNDLSTKFIDAKGVKGRYIT